MKYTKPILVFTPTLGESKTLSRTIKSVKNISHDLVDHIIICPKKSSKKLLNIYKDNDYLIEPENINGVFESINWAFKNLENQYQYFTYINDDDYWLQGMYKLLSYCLTSKKDIIYSNNIYIDPSNNLIYKGSNFPNTHLFCNLSLRGIPQFTQQSVLIKFKTFKENNYFDESLPLNADTDLFYRMIKNGASSKYINTLSSAYTLGPGRLTSLKSKRDQAHELFLNKHYKKNKKTVLLFLSVLIFRFYNLPLYIERFLKKFFNLKK